MHAQALTFGIAFTLAVTAASVTAVRSQTGPRAYDFTVVPLMRGTLIPSSETAPRLTLGQPAPPYDFAVVPLMRGTLIPSSEQGLTRMRTALAVARSDYLAVRVAEYRMDIFGLLRQTRSLTSAGLARRLSLIIDEAIAHGGDGLEPLLLAYADAIATRGDANAKKSAIADLRRGAAEMRFRAKQIPSGTPVPLGLDRSYVVLDVRADAMRAFVHGLFDYPTAFGLGDVFGRVKTKKDECGLPAQPGNPGAPISPAPASPSETPTLAALAADQQRQDDCAKFGGSQKGIAGQLGDVASAACLNLDNFKENDEYTPQEQAADLEQCMNDITDMQSNPLADGLGPTVVGEVMKFLAAGASDAAKAVLKAALEVGKKGAEEALTRAIDDYYKQKAEERARADRDKQAAIDRDTAATSAMLNLIDAQRAADAADQAYKDAQAATNQAQARLSDKVDEQTMDRYKREASQAEERERHAADDSKAAHDRLDKAKQEADKAVAAVQANKASEPRDETGKLSAACSRLITGGKNIANPVDMRRLPADWGTLSGRLRNKINPNPEADPRASAADALGWPQCGVDRGTLADGRLDCGKVTLCTDPSGTSGECACNPDRNHSQSEIQKLAARTAILACSTLNCPEGTNPTSHGVVCACDAKGSAEPVPPRPSPEAIGATFAFDPSKPFAPSITQWQDSPLATMATGMTRSDITPPSR